MCFKFYYFSLPEPMFEPGLVLMMTLRATRHLHLDPLAEPDYDNTQPITKIRK